MKVKHENFFNSYTFKNYVMKSKGKFFFDIAAVEATGIILGGNSKNVAHLCSGVKSIIRPAEGICLDRSSITNLIFFFFFKQVRNIF